MKLFDRLHPTRIDHSGGTVDRIQVALHQEQAVGFDEAGFVPDRTRGRKRGRGEHLRGPFGDQLSTGAKEPGATAFEAQRSRLDVLVPRPGDGLGPTGGDLDPARPGAP